MAGKVDDQKLIKVFRKVTKKEKKLTVVILRVGLSEQ